MIPVSGSRRMRIGEFGAVTAIVVLAFGPACGQVKKAGRDQGFIVPRVIDGQAIEGVVINGAVLLFRGPVADGPADDFADMLTPQTEQRVTLHRGTIDEIIYGAGSDAAQAYTRLQNLLKQKLDAIDRIVGLNEVERQKLHLAGRGDIQRLLDRAERLRTLCNDSTEIADMRQFRLWTQELQRESQWLKHVLEAGPFDADSLLKKTMKTVLTREQLARFNRYKSTPPYQRPERHPARFEGAIQLR
jgi:hypothetical protein